MFSFVLKQEFIVFPFYVQKSVQWRQFHAYIYMGMILFSSPEFYLLLHVTDYTLLQVSSIIFPVSVKPDWYSPKSFKKHSIPLSFGKNGNGSFQQRGFSLSSACRTRISLRVLNTSTHNFPGH